MLTALQIDLFAPEDAASTDTTTTSTERIGVMYRCAHCESHTRRPAPWRVTFTRTIHRASGTALQWTDATNHTTPGPTPPTSRCGTCQRSSAGRPVEGTYSAAHRCDDRCIYARGHICECSCGGKNHGRGFNR